MVIDLEGKTAVVTGGGMGFCLGAFDRKDDQRDEYFSL